MPKPNKKTYGDLNVAYDFFNNILFDGRLPRCLITMQHRAGFCAIRSAREESNTASKKYRFDMKCSSGKMNTNHAMVGGEGLEPSTSCL